MVTRQADILISGGGIPGLTLAILLADLGLDITLLEPFPPESIKKTKPSGRTVALMDSSLNIIKATGVWDAVKLLSNPLETMRIIDDSAFKQDEIEAPFEAVDAGLEQFGFNIPNNHLRATLFEKAKQNKNITILKQKLERLNANGEATLENDKTIKATLVVGADGRNSAVREQSGIGINKQEYGQSAITCLINHSKSHKNVSTEFHRPGGPLAFVPLPGNQSSVVWVEKTARAEEIIRLKKGEFEQALEKKSKNILGGLTLEAGPEMWPLVSLQSTSLIAPRVALIAETAHVMSPITAQGLNLSLRDVGALAETIADAGRLGLDYGSQTILKKYEKRRRLDITTRVMGVDGMNRLVSQEVEALKRIRRTGLKAVNKIPTLKRQAMHHGLKPTLDLGRLASGEKL